MAARKALVPPRPNLGPDPLPDGVATGWWVGLSVLVVMVVMASLWRWRRRRRVMNAASLEAAVGLGGASGASAEDLMLGLGVSVRGLLIERFGQVWRAKTTEELATSLDLAKILGEEGLAELVAVLDRVDQIKFASAGEESGRSLEGELGMWRPRADGVMERLSKAKVESNGRGKGKRERVGQSESEDLSVTSAREKRTPRTSVL